MEIDFIGRIKEAVTHVSRNNRLVGARILSPVDEAKVRFEIAMRREKLDQATLNSVGKEKNDVR